MRSFYTDNPIRDWDSYCDYTTYSHERYYNKICKILYNILDDIKLFNVMDDYISNLIDMYIESNAIDDIFKDFTAKNVLLGLGNLDSFILEKGYLIELEEIGFDSTDLYSFLNIAKHISEWIEITTLTQNIIDNAIATI